ncbi:peroxin-3 [Coniochaeta ligniaria NRRL 30616]|uniref:Peroxin-3 n=1 Tax=Coniochaeta ligniaria NRRL 30616 TaxID=1408157 RepID=A0A1J7JVD8_9PEZI|nr:peroxin-3 [Coniochaeta ligniaria NRRL 30616]
MFAGTRRWLRRNRTPLAVGLGVVGAGYVVTQYVLTKINDARERMSSDRIAKENLRRRFEQNQEDCTFTVLALLPTATTNILEAMNTEKITYDIQQMKSSSTTSKSIQSIGSSTPPSISETQTTDDDGRSIVSLPSQADSAVHASQASLAPAPTLSTSTEAAAATAGSTDAPQPSAPPKPRRTKRQLWDDLTISSITRAYTLIYTLALLTMLTRIQLNLLGRRSYLSSVVSLATGSPQATINLENNDDDNPQPSYGSDFDINRKYLTFSWWLLNRGWAAVAQRVEASVRSVFGHLSPRDTLTLDTFSALTTQCRQLIEGSQPGGPAGANWLPDLLPPADMEDLVLRESGVLDDTTPSPSSPATTSTTASLRRLLDETADLIESPPFAHVLTLLLDAGFAHLLQQKVVSGAFETPATLHTDVVQALPPQEPLNRAVLLPKILSVLTRQAHAIGNGMPNEYLREMEGVRDLEGFAAVVYSSNWESEIRPDGEEGGLVTSVLSGDGDGTVTVAGEESLVVVDPSASLESAWERATTG